MWLNIVFYCPSSAFLFFSPVFLTYLTKLLLLKYKFHRIIAWPVNEKVEGFLSISRGLIDVLWRNLNLCIEGNPERHDWKTGVAAWILICQSWVQSAWFVPLLASNTIEDGRSWVQGEGKWRKIPSWLKGKVARDTVRQGFFKFHFIKIPLTW